jgi:hypothetical protein
MNFKNLTTKPLFSFFLIIVLTIVYVSCGYLVGYHRGYKEGQRNYVSYIESMLKKSNNQ